MAIELAVNNDFFATFDFEGMSAAETFYTEMKQSKLSTLGGFYTTVDLPAAEKTLEQLMPEDIMEISTLRVNKLNDNFNMSDLLNLTTLEELVIFDKERFPNVYKLYEVFYSPHNSDAENENLKLSFLTEISNHAYLKELKLLLIDKKREDVLQYLQLKSKSSQKELLDLVQLIKRKEHILTGEFKEADSLFKAIKLLKQKLPNCKFYY